MVGPSKILTVSYGTFSCTLEGFDESFELMKSIAEYFRDLAAEDRYFGAEPPSPDAEMLAQIAEREISRRVEARTNGSDVQLRATPQLTDERATQTPMAAAPAPQPQPVRVQPQPAAAAAPISGEVIPPAEDSVAAKLRRIRAAVGGSAPVTEFTEEAVQDQLAPTFFDAEADPETAFMAEEDALPASAGFEAVVTADPAPVAEEAPVAEVTEAEAEPAIEDVVAEAEEAEVETAEVEEAEAETAEAETVEAEEPEAETADTDVEAAEAEAAEAADDVAQTEEAAADQGETTVSDIMASLGADTAEEDVVEAAAEEAPAQNDDDAVANLMASLEEAASGDDPEASFEQLEAGDAEDLEEAETAEITEEPTKDEGAAGGPLDLQAFRLEPAQETPAVAESPAAPQEEDETLEAAIAETADEPAAEAPTQEEDDFEARLTAALAADDFEADAAEEAKASAAPEAEGEDDFEASLAAALSDEETPDAPAQEAKATRRVFSLRRRKDAEPGSDTPSDASDEDRIFAKAENELDEPAGKSRRNAIAQLKAAVAATEAARTMGESDSTESAGEEPYRDDLNRVVRPGRGAAGDAAPNGAAPLKLVASQRVDEPAPEAPAEAAPEAPAANVQPRRVSVSSIERREAEIAQDPAAASRSFSEYADTVGAKALPELLEAAAAYTSFVEKRESFSRPQIIRKIREMSGDEFSREDSLRSFGALLRQGRITKLRGGQFQVSEETRFRPDAGPEDHAVGE